MTSYTFTANYFRQEPAKEFQIHIIAFSEQEAMQKAKAKAPEGYELINVQHKDSKGRILNTIEP